jgi:hypothetical protein
VGLRRLHLDRSFDRRHDELFVVHQGVVRIFNRAGMEIHSFGADGDLGHVSSVAALDDGDLVALADLGGKTALVRCNFRGEPTGRIEPQHLPAGFPADFRPDTLALQGDRLYLAETGAMRVLVIGLDGEFQAFHRLRKLLELEEGPGGGGLGGFSVDAQGNMLLTVPTLFTAYVVSPKGFVRRFGTRGSTPGKLNIAGKLVADETGHLFLTDRLRCVVMVFDATLEFLEEFGYRGDHPGNLVAPLDVVAGSGMVFVAQAGNRGVAAFRLAGLTPVPAAAAAPSASP